MKQLIKYAILFFFIPCIAYSQFWELQAGPNIIITVSDTGYTFSVDSLKLHSGRLKVIENMLAGLRDSSRNWRTYLTNGDTCLTVDSSVSGKYIIGYNRNCGGSLSVDTIPILGRRFTALAQYDCTVTVDTSRAIYFTNRATKNNNYTETAAFFTVPVSAYITGIAINHVIDSGNVLLWRDTVRTIGFSGADSITAGSQLFVSVYPASIGYPPSNGGVNQQKIVLLKRNRNEYPTVSSATYSVDFISATHTKLPLALPSDGGVNPCCKNGTSKQRGLMLGSFVTVTVYFAEKIIGRNY